MGSRIPSHQLSSGLYVSGRPEQLKERTPTMGSRAVPYTGGDIKKSGELGKMFDIHHVNPPVPGPPPSKSSSSQHNSGSVRSGPNSGPVTKHSNSGPIPKKSSGPISLPPTGLITSGPMGSGPLGSSNSGGGGSGGRRSGPLEQTVSAGGKMVYGTAVTSLSEDVKIGFKVSKAVVWVFLVILATGLLVGAFLMVAVKKPILLVAAGGLLVPAVVAVLWNIAWGKRGLIGFVQRYPDAELRGAIDGQYVKVTGVVTCGSIPLESSYQRVGRCVYVSSELYEYKGWGGKPANPKHRCFSWGSRYSEIAATWAVCCPRLCEKSTEHYHIEEREVVTKRYVADFYISDFQSGLRALVKAGNGAKVAPFVKPSTVVNVTKENRDLSPSFLSWLADRKLSSDDRVMRLKEGYIKEGSTMSVMGVVRRQDNVLMIVPSAEPVSTGCQWTRWLLPTYAEGLIITCEDNQDADVVPV